jgi:Adenylosuccinate synthase
LIIIIIKVSSPFIIIIIKLLIALTEKNHLLQNLYGVEPVSLDQIMTKVAAWAERLGPFLGDTWRYLQAADREGKKILFEGAQGVMLDIDHGTYPFVTSSNPVAGSVSTGAGLPPSKIGGVLALVKAYSTRVGSGPFPTELHDRTGDRLREKGAEFGTTTGRPRRCGWLDAVVVRSSADLCGVDHLAVTKLDVLTGLPELKIATHYLLDGEKIDYLPADFRELDRCVPVYESWPGFDEDITRAKRLEDLPAAARRYLDRLSELAGAPLGLVSVGPDRAETIILHEYF